MYCLLCITSHCAVTAEYWLCNCCCCWDGNWWSPSIIRHLNHACMTRLITTDGSQGLLNSGAATLCESVRFLIDPAHVIYSGYSSLYTDWWLTGCFISSEVCEPVNLVNKTLEALGRIKRRRGWTGSLLFNHHCGLGASLRSPHLSSRVHQRRSMWPH